MKFTIYEEILNEYVNYPTRNQLTQIEANSKEEAENMLKVLYPTRKVLMEKVIQ